MSINKNIESIQNFFKRSRVPNLGQIYQNIEDEIEVYKDESPIDLEWIKDETFRNSLSINSPMEKKYLIKWEDLSYLDCTWEKATFLD